MSGSPPASDNSLKPSNPYPAVLYIWVPLTKQIQELLTECSVKTGLFQSEAATLLLERAPEFKAQFSGFGATALSALSVEKHLRMKISNKSFAKMEKLAIFKTRRGIGQVAARILRDQRIESLQDIIAALGRLYEDRRSWPDAASEIRTRFEAHPIRSSEL